MAQGKCKFSFIGIREGGEVSQYEDSMDFRCELPLGNIQIPQEKDCRIQIMGGAKSLELEPDGESLRTRLDLDGTLVVFGRENFSYVSSLERGEAYEEGEDCILFVYPEEGEDLWSLSKRYHISPEKIRAENDITQGALPVFLKILR